MLPTSRPFPRRGAFLSEYEVLRRLVRHVEENFELYLMVFSVAVALAIPLAIEVGTDVQELAVTALGACVFQGLVLWLLRRQNRRVRREMIAELRAMLKDRINNHLTIVLMSVTQRRDSRASNTERELLEAAIAATAAVSRVLEELSMESLRHWKAKYQIDEVPWRKVSGYADREPATAANGNAADPDQVASGR